MGWLTRKKEESSHRISDTDIRGVWDDIAQAKKWYPILHLLKDVEDSRTFIEKLRSLEPLVEFIVRVGLGASPTNILLFELFRDLVDWLDENPQACARLEQAIALQDIQSYWQDDE